MFNFLGFGDKQESVKSEVEKIFIPPENINDIKFYCEWNDNLEKYVLLFPQISEKSEDLNEGYVSEEDWLIEISDNPEEVRTVFEEVKKMAQGLRSPKDLFTSVKAYLAQRS